MGNELLKSLEKYALFRAWVRQYRGKLNVEFEAYSGDTIAVTWQPSARARLGMRVLGPEADPAVVMNRLRDLKERVEEFEREYGSHIRFNPREPFVRNRYDDENVSVIRRSSSLDVLIRPMMKEDGHGSGVITAIMHTHTKRNTTVHIPPSPLSELPGSYRQIFEYPAELNVEGWPPFHAWDIEGKQVWVWDDLRMLAGSMGIAIVQNDMVLESRALMLA